MIRLTLPYPISSNRYWASRVIKAKATGKWMAMTYVTPEAKVYKAQVEDAARAAGITAPLAGRFELVVQLYPHRPLDWQKRMRLHGDAWDDTVQCVDLGNCEKVLSDALQGPVLENDKFARRMVLERMEPDAEGARLVVTITAIGVRNPQLELVA